MDTVFFLTSKLVWAVISPDSLILIILVTAWICLWLGMRKLARKLLALVTLSLLLIAFLPLGEWVIAPLEERFPVHPALPVRVDGIIVLGGPIDPELSAQWGQIQFLESGERLTTFVSLARRFPQAKLVFSGGSGRILQQDYSEADSARQLFNDLGLVSRDIIYETESRNTHENALYSKPLAQPRPEENWVLVTSAFHMPRAVGVFCRQNWNTIPYPVDYYSRPAQQFRIGFNLDDHLKQLTQATREWVGLLAYRVTNRTRPCA